MLDTQRLAGVKFLAELVECVDLFRRTLQGWRVCEYNSPLFTNSL
jgi:hypothetical protein